MQIRPITPADVTGEFTCGRPALDEYLRKRAWGHEQQGVARVFVLEDLAPPGNVLGYYTLAASAWERERRRVPLSGSLPTHPLPVLYIGHVAGTTTRQRQGSDRG